MSAYPTRDAGIGRAGLWQEFAARFQTWLTRLCALAALGVALLAVVVVQVQGQGQRALRQSDRAFDSGQLQPATEFARQAATWYLPNAEHVTRAHQRLLAIALGAESTGDTPTAIAAWSTLRSVLYDTSHPFNDAQPLLVEANTHLARLLGQMLPPAQRDDVSQLEQSFRLRGASLNLFSLCTSFGAALLLFACWRRFFARDVADDAVFRVALGVGLLLWTFAALGA